MILIGRRRRRRRLQAGGLAPLLVCLLTGVAMGQDQNGSVSGVITDAVTHEPIRKAVVLLSRMGPDVQPVVTDGTGSFRFSDVAPGEYQVLARHQNYPMNGGFREERILVRPGEVVSLKIELTPGASVSGRILDEDGDPLNGCFAQIHPAAHPDWGARADGGEAENGEYRLYGIAPGKYIVGVQCRIPPFQPRPFSAGPDPPPTLGYPTQFYPLVSDAKSASVVDLAPGVEKTGIDFRIRLAPITQIHGRFSAGGTAWRPGMRVGVQLIPVERGAASPQIIAANVDVAKGTFELPRVFPGVYFLVAQSLQDGSQIGAFQRVEVKDRPIDVVLELRGATQVAGTVRVEGDNANRVSLKNVNIQLVPDAYALQQPPQAAVNEDGAFSLPVLPGQWRVVANAPWSYVKSVYLGTQDITNGVLDLSSGADGPLRIVMSTNTATIQGTAPPGYIVIAERIGAASPFMGTTQWMPDPNGRFVMAPLAPGSYRLVAVISGGAPADNGGTEVTVGEGETATVEVKAGQ